MGKSAEYGSPEDASLCCGLNFVKGFVIDHANRDIVLYGDRVSDRPAILLDDLTVCVQNIWHPERIRYVSNQYPSPYCSLDPANGSEASINRAMQDVDILSLQDDLERNLMIGKLAAAMGPQQTRIGEIPSDVRFAHAMIDADYHMKKVSQGHLSIPGVTSCLRLGLQRQTQPPTFLRSLRRAIGLRPSANGSRMSRFWFHLAKDQPKFIEAEGIVEIANCDIVLLTERQKSTSDGSLVDGGGEDPDAETFAETMSQHLRKKNTGVPEYDDLINLYRLFAVLKAVQFKQAEVTAGLDLTPLLNHAPQQMPMPDSLPALANIGTELVEASKEQRWFCSMVCGGVSIDVSLARSNFSTSVTGHSVNKRSLLDARPSHESISWLVPAVV